MEDRRTLHDSNVHNESTIWVVLRLTGGKPIIYLFPPRLIVDASVVLGLTPSWSFSAVYPKASDVSPDHGLHAIEWTVDARADGVLVHRASGSELSYLFWEAHTCPAPPLSPPTSRPSTPTEDADNSVHFDPARPQLSPRGSVLLGVEKLPIYLDRALKELSLPTEARNSFITYWLPSFLKHKHIALRFLSQASYEAAAPMTVTPAPDVVTRVFMLFKGVDERDVGTWAEAGARATHDVAFWKKAVGVDAEHAEDRSLFRVLEWGGMEVM
ncbi:hypothetical protein OF83DRAFT_1239957 [Amylostereum chailletii]|nr:hypothetical protein OF83DRAFT_1239957 [Amylostereum chailletii]